MSSVPLSSGGPSSSQALRGWVLESPGRGTLNLIITCLFTISLCTWVVIHPRVTKCPLHRRIHKLVQFIKAIIAPEFIAVEGLQEWTQARKMAMDCEKSMGKHFKLVHAFYIGMLALRYRTSVGSRVIWPNQFTWLLEQDLITPQSLELWGISEDDILDKSNADDAVKVVALCQVSWFVAQSIMRTTHGLPLSQLESMALSYVPLFAVTYFFWWLKPKDILMPTLIDLPNMPPEQKTTFDSMAISNKFDDEGVGQQGSIWTTFALTPRVFEKTAEGIAPTKIEQTVRERVDTNEKANESCDNPSTERKRKEIVLAWWDPELYHSKLWPVTCLFGVSFGALHLISWYTVFPTFVEQWLWRVAALVLVVSMLIFMQFEKVILRWDSLLSAISLLSPVFYLISRIIMMGGVVASLRASDPAIYDTYVVANYWIHIV